MIEIFIHLYIFAAIFAKSLIELSILTYICLSFSIRMTYTGCWKVSLACYEDVNNILIISVNNKK